MRFLFFISFFIASSLIGQSQAGETTFSDPDYVSRIRKYIDTLEIVDTHEHFFNPELLRATNFLDFSLLLQQNSFDGFLAAGMPAELLKKLYIEPTSLMEKWKIIEPYWNKSNNTIANKILLGSIKDLYDIHDLNAATVEMLSGKIREAYSGNWFNYVLKDLCRFRYVITDGDNLGKRDDYIRYVRRFSPWLTVNTKFRIDSIAVMQVEPIYTLEDFVKSMTSAFEDALKRGMVAVKINSSYKRSLHFEKVPVETARKVFRTIINGNEDFVLQAKDALPLQDYMMFRLLDLARKYKVPIAVHTGIQAGLDNNLAYSDPVLLVNLFREYPDVNYVLFHGSYPFGGEAATIVRNYPNVYIDMNWTWSISPTYAGHYLTQWLEAVPASKIMAFGGDQRCVENTYGNLKVAKKVIGDVLIEKVSSGYFTEQEACRVARMILLENPLAFYKLR